ncbi:MAG: Asp-tRNA(Asn)/Glu-tRNA(Gln) amidotransferase subunit GatA [Chloroflexi bacterium]|nr:Asp-tRNA(Asn)/Glu-tRNA(Gln) amidotransferase subunit GatA [Chloroflexota bacterium]
MPTGTEGKELYYLTIEEAGRLLRRKELSPVDLTQAYLDRIQAVDGQVHSYLTLLPESALAEARRVEGEIIAGNYRGPLHGIPIGLKDLFDTEGVPTTGGSRVFQDRVPSRDATVVAKLKQAGSILLGKLTMSELAMTGPAGIGEEARNPWNVDHIPGSSSSGSGVAVAAGLCAGALGSDTGGSVRFPASLNGIVGLLPTYGRVSRYGGIPLSWSLDHFGPMTRTVEDAALMLKIIAGHDPLDPTSSAAPVPDYRRALTGDIKGLTIGVLASFYSQYGQSVHPETTAAVEQAVKDLEEMGARVEEVEIPHLEYASIAGVVIYLTEGFACYREVLRTRADDLGDIILRYLYTGGLFTGADYVQAQRVRGLLKREVAQVLKRVDLIAAPATTGPATAFKDFDPLVLLDARRAAASNVFNLVGSPAISVPCGFSEAGLPIGLQLAGRPLDEATVLKVAYAYQQRRPFFKKHPPPSKNWAGPTPWDTAKQRDQDS